MNRTILLVVSSAWQAGTMFSYKRGLESFGYRVETFHLDAARLAASPAPKILDPLVRRLLAHIDIPSMTQRGNRELVAKAMEARPDMVLVTCNEAVRASTLVHLKVVLPETKLVSIFPDTLFNMRESLVACLPVYDLFATHTRAGIPQLERLGCRSPFYLPLAADPALHHPMPLTEADQRRLACDVAYVGNWRPEHEQLFARLEGLDFTIWGGPLWDRSRKGSWVRSRWNAYPIDTPEKYAKAHIAAKVCLNPIDPLNFPGHNQRLFELPACGAFSLVTRTADTTSIFREGESIACFSSAEELVEKVRHYLSHGEERARIAAEAHRLVVDGGHTYRDRAGQLLDRLGMSV